MKQMIRSVCALALVTSACAAPVPSASPASSAPSEDARALAWRDVQSLVGDASCDADSQCQVIAVGARACGGPSGFLAWSSKGTDESQLKAAVTRHAELERSWLKQAGMASDCRVMVRPNTVCSLAAPGTTSGRHCVLLRPGPGAQPR